MRLLETCSVAGLLLVSACYTDLGCESEAISGYYSRPWRWDLFAKNAGFVIQFHSIDDPLIPVAEARHVAEHAKTTYFEVPKSSHFFDEDDVLPALEALVARVRAGHDASTLYHLVGREEFEQQRRDHVERGYLSHTFSADGGFIHATAEANSLLPVANHFYSSDKADYVCVRIDVALLKSPVR